MENIFTTDEMTRLFTLIDALMLDKIIIDEIEVDLHDFDSIGSVDSHKLLDQLEGCLTSELQRLNKVAISAHREMARLSKLIK